MATLSLYEISDSQLSETPIKDGQIVCCLDTGCFYRDTKSERIPLGSDIIYVISLPLAPISNKVYLLKPNKLYIYDEDWVLLNDIPETVVTKDTLYEFPSVGKESCIYIARNQNRTYRFDATELKYYCVGSDYNEIDVIDGGSASS